MEKVQIYINGECTSIEIDRVHVKIEWISEKTIKVTNHNGLTSIYSGFPFILTRKRQNED